MVDVNKQYYLTSDMDLEDMAQMLSEQDDDIDTLLNTIRDIYSLCGEDKIVSNLCNEVLEDSRFEGI